MITVLTGNNEFEIERALKTIVGQFNGMAEYIDGSELELRQLPDLLMSAILFVTERLIVIKRFSQNKALWNTLSAWLPRIDESIHLVLIEPTLDKRTKLYKELNQAADVREYKLWTNRDELQAEKWVVEEAKGLGFVMTTKYAKLLIERVGFDQWALYTALQKLSVVEEITPAVIEDIIDANPTENVFNLFDAALRRDVDKVLHMLSILHVSEDPYRLFGLLNSQVLQLVALGVTDRPQAELAKELGMHPFAMSKLSPVAKSIGKAGVKKVVTAFAEADSGLKTSAGEPWLLIERALIKVASL